MSLNSYLITGGCGFIGSNLIRNILEKYPHSNIRVLDNLSVGTKKDLKKICDFNVISCGDVTSSPQGIELLVGDITEIQDCVTACKGIQVAVHLAANTGVNSSVKNPGKDLESNVVGTFNTLEAARQNGVRKYVYASSGAAVGEANPPIHEELASRPVSPYGASKLAGEAYCSAYFRTYGLNTIALRFGNVYGPGSRHKGSVVAEFIRKALVGENLKVYGDGNQTRDFIYIKDITHAILLSMEADIDGEVFQIATHRETTVNELAEKIKHLVENETTMKVKIIHENPRIGDVRRNYSDISKAGRLLGYTPVYNLESGLKATIDYFRRTEPRS
ncbi:MAG: NAD-dependent epimerase/dehydratase family protein [Candidatus Brocadiaceae bacterium]|nr:NAD-dependent epimerase/dehydratase family protein [Candidatus Brocadiaceae bacterium]